MTSQMGNLRVYSEFVPANKQFIQSMSKYTVLSWVFVPIFYIVAFVAFVVNQFVCMCQKLLIDKKGVVTQNVNFL